MLIIFNRLQDAADLHPKPIKSITYRHGARKTKDLDATDLDANWTPAHP